MAKCVDGWLQLPQGRGNARSLFGRRVTVSRGSVALFTALVMIAVSGGRATASPAPDGAKLFSLNCVVCHGEDGKGTETGKALMAADLGSTDVQKQTNAMLEQAISEGKNNMPPFMSTLSKADIASLVVYVRTFAKKAK
jgi:cytochrome c6